jgi:hypothetical protein
MSSWRKAVLFGFIVWLVPFLVGVLVYPVRQTSRSLFESIMPVVLSIVVVACAVWYFKRVETVEVREGVWLGLLWLAVSLAIDLPLMLSPPMSFTPAEYFADIGLTYLMMPVITTGIAVAARSRAGDGSEPQGGNVAR